MMATPPDHHRVSWKLVRDDVVGHTLCIYAVHCKSSGHLAVQLVLYGIMHVNVLLQERLTSHSSGLLLHDIHGSPFLSVLLTSCFEGLSVPTPLARSPPIFGTAGPQRLHLVMVWFAFLFSTDYLHLHGRILSLVIGEGYGFYGFSFHLLSSGVHVLRN